MTLDELKAEAKAHGYRLMPITPYIKLMPCKCGRKRLEIWYRTDGSGCRFVKCPSCGLTAPDGRNEREARKNWNKRVMPDEP